MTCPGLRKINFVLALAGHQISAGKKWQQIMRSILLLLCLIRVLTVMITDLTRYTALNKPITMFHISDTMFTVCTLTFHLSTGLKHSSISEFITKYRPLMTHEYKDRLEAVGRRNLAFFCLFFVAQYLNSVCYHQPFGVCRWKASHVFIFPDSINQLEAIVIHTAMLYECLVYQCWMAMSFCLFNYCLTVKQEVIRCKLNHLHGLILNRDSGSLQHLESPAIAFMRTIQDEFDSSFSIFPFLVFAANFLQTSGYLLFLMDSTIMDVNYKIFQVMASLSYLTVSLLMSMTALPGKNKTVAKRIIQVLDKTYMTTYDASIISSINEIVDRKESAWLFELDSRMILPFVGHVITFSVVFMQLMPSKKS